MVPAPLSQQLDELTDLLGQLAGTAAGTMQRATAALLESRVRLAEQAFASDLPVRELRDRIEDLAGDALLFHAPVAGDLRAVVSAIRGASDIARMNDLALHVAEVVRMRAPNSAVPEEVREDFRQMGGVAVQLARKAGEVLRSRNVVMAKELDADDDVIDDIHARMFGVLMDPAGRTASPGRWTSRSWPATTSASPTTRWSSPTRRSTPSPARARGHPDLSPQPDPRIGS